VARLTHSTIVLVALTVWNDHIATVADFSQRLLVVEIEHGRTCAFREIDAPGKDASRWCARLAAEGISTLICGAITRHLDQQLDASGIAVVDGCSGPSAAVLEAWLAGTVSQPQWRMPGCHRWRGERHGCARHVGRPQRAPAHPMPASTETHPMRVAISTSGLDLDAAMDPRFGRTRHLVVCATDSETITHHENPTAVNAEHGAGIKTAEFVASLGVQAVISGAVGPKAMQVLRAAGIKAYASTATSARAALAELRSGKLSEVP
jgi:predicted Fe-Mo cluster-binding NifX family protein